MMVRDFLRFLRYVKAKTYTNGFLRAGENIKDGESYMLAAAQELVVNRLKTYRYEPWVYVSNGYAVGIDINEKYGMWTGFTVELIPSYSPKHNRVYVEPILKYGSPYDPEMIPEKIDGRKNKWKNMGICREMTPEEERETNYGYDI